MNWKIAPKDNLRLYVGSVIMQRRTGDRLDTVCCAMLGWHPSPEAAVGKWIARAFADEEAKGYHLACQPQPRDVTEAALAGAEIVTEAMTDG